LFRNILLITYREKNQVCSAVSVIDLSVISSLYRRRRHPPMKKNVVFRGP